jgi:putative oxidoreductase
MSGFALGEETFFLFRDEYKMPLLPLDLAAYLSTIADGSNSAAAKRR